MTQSPLDRLSSLIAGCTAAGVGRQALLFRGDRLPAALSRPHHHRLAEAALAPLLNCARAELFHLPGPRMVVAWRGDADAALLDVIDALQHLLADSSVGTPSLRELMFLFDLPDAADLLLAALEDAAVLHTAPVTLDPPLDPASLLLLEAILAHADLSRFARRETIWRLGLGAPPGTPLAAWEKRSLSVPGLGAELMPGFDLAGGALAAAAADANAGPAHAGVVGEPRRARGGEAVRAGPERVQHAQGGVPALRRRPAT